MGYATLATMRRLPNDGAAIALALAEGSDTRKKGTTTRSKGTRNRSGRRSQMRMPGLIGTPSSSRPMSARVARLCMAAAYTL